MVQINYGALNLSAPERVRFRYRLDGFDTSWIDAETRHQAYYTNLPAGRYQFRVTADHNDNLWNERGATIAIVIKPAFYQTTWFVAASALALGLLLLTAWQLRVRVIRTRYAAVLAERARVARDIHDTLLQSLAGIALHLEVIAGQLESSPAWARQQLQRAGERVKLDIREARRAIWDLRPALDRQHLPSQISDVASRAIENSSLELRTVVQGAVPATEPAVEDHLVRITQEAVANAVRHAHASQVRVELAYARRLLTLRIVDDGVGFDPSAVPPPTAGGFGLSNMAQRARQLGGKFAIRSAPGAGTTIEVITTVK
jgi:signal transduction histidine kinase